MTKLLYAHDHIFYTDGLNYYSNGSFSSEVLKRYADVFDEMKFISRQSKIENVTNNLTVATHEKVSFLGIPNIRSAKGLINYSKVNHIIKTEVQSSDCLIARLPSTIGEIAVKHARKLKKPYLIELVGCAWDSNINHGSIFGKILAPVEYFINKNYVKKAPNVIYITKEFLQNRYPTNGTSTVCPNVNIEVVDSGVLQDRIDRIESDRDLIKFGLIGSLDVDYKGHDTIIKALGLIKNEIPNFTIEFLGKGNQKRWTKLIEDNDLRDNVVFVGSLPSGNKVYEWMDNIDVMIQPSYAEAQGRSIIEAMSRGCPIISSRVGGIVELIDSDWLIKAGDYEDLSEKIKLLLSDKAIQLKQSQKNYEEAKQYYKTRIEEKRREFLELFKSQIQ